MHAHQLSSGDLIADRRAEYAQMLAESGDMAAAADLMGQALERVPDWAAGWFRLAEYAEKGGAISQAVQALDRVLGLNAEDMFGAGLKRAVLSGSAMPEQPPSAYVARLFDDYADRFDAALVERLAYTVPERLAAMIEAAREAASDGLAIGRAIDLGCGTGLLGARIRPMVGTLEGYDLSANMLAKAAEKSVYDDLAQADLTRPPAESGLICDTRPEGRADLVTAADVLMYLGDLLPVFATVPRLLAPRGLFAFSVEEALPTETGEDPSVVLLPSLRYAHSEAYIVARSRAAGLDILETRRATIRKDGANDIQGILFLSQKTA